ncbi:Nramp family divalent metal transporter, partial [Microlunatus capsulatus]
SLFGLQLDGLTEVHTAISTGLGPVVAILFALALLASGLASTSVGGYAGTVIMDGLLHRRIPLLWRRLATAIPALVLLGAGADPTRLLILSQVVLSFGIPFALIPLVRIARDPKLMALVPTRPATIAITWTVVAAIVALNALLLVLLITG